MISGRDESILPAVRARVEQTQDGARLAPFVYLFKPVGSRQSTIEFKEQAVRQLLAECARVGARVRQVLCLDDVEPQLQALRHGCGGAPKQTLFASRPLVSRSFNCHRSIPGQRYRCDRSA